MAGFCSKISVSGEEKRFSSFCALAHLQSAVFFYTRKGNFAIFAPFYLKL